MVGQQISSDAGGEICIKLAVVECNGSQLSVHFAHAGSPQISFDLAEPGSIECIEKIKKAIEIRINDGSEYVLPNLDRKK